MCVCVCMCFVCLCVCCVCVFVFVFGRLGSVMLGSVRLGRDSVEFYALARANSGEGGRGAEWGWIDFPENPHR